MNNSNTHSRNFSQTQVVDKKDKPGNEDHPHHFFSTIKSVNTYVESQLGSEIHKKQIQVNRTLNILVNLTYKDGVKPKKKLNFFKKIFQRKKKLFNFSDKIKISNETNVAVPSIIFVNHEKEALAMAKKKGNVTRSKAKCYSSFSYADIKFSNKKQKDKSSPLKSGLQNKTTINAIIMEKYLNRSKSKSKSKSKANSPTSSPKRGPKAKFSINDIKSKIINYEALKTNFKHFNLNNISTAAVTGSNNTMSNIGSTFLTLGKDTYSSNVRATTQCTTERNLTTTNATNGSNGSIWKPYRALNIKTKSAVSEINKKYSDKIREFKQENHLNIP